MGPMEPVEIDDPDLADAEPLVEFPETDPQASTFDPELTASIAPQKIGAQGYWWWGTYEVEGERAYIEVPSSSTCFLQGVTGELQSADGSSIPARVTVDIDSSRGEWFIETDAGQADADGDGGSGLIAHVTCIETAKNRFKIIWDGNTNSGPNTTNSWVPRLPDSRCFLTEVRGTVGWTSEDSFVNLYESKRGSLPTWELDGNLVTEQDGSAGGGAKAYCVQVPYEISPNYSWTAPPTSGATQLTNTTKRVTCSVQRLQGNFASNPIGIWDGMRIYPGSVDGADRWFIAGAGSKQIGGECIQRPTLPF